MWLAIILFLYLLPVLAVWLPSITRSLDAFWRRNSTGVVILVAALAFYLTANVGRAIAAKGGGTNTPPPVAVAPSTKRINLFYQDATGRLVPLGATIKNEVHHE